MGENDGVTVGLTVGIEVGLAVGFEVVGLAVVGTAVAIPSQCHIIRGEISMITRL